MVLMAAIMKDLCFTEYLDTWSISQLINTQLLHIYNGKVQDKKLVETLKRLKDYESVCIFILPIKEFGIILATHKQFYAIYWVPFENISEVSYDKAYPN